MTLPKTLTYSVLGITAVAAGLTSGLLISSSAQTNTPANTSNTSAVSNTNQPLKEAIDKRRGGPGGMMGEKGGDNTLRKAVMDALDKKDYDAWKKAVAADIKNPNKDTLLSKVNTQDKFNKLADAHIAVKDAHTKQQAVRTELGLKARPQPGQNQSSSNTTQQ